MPRRLALREKIVWQVRHRSVLKRETSGTGMEDPLNPMNGGDIFVGEQQFDDKPRVMETIPKWSAIIRGRGEPEVVFSEDGVTLRRATGEDNTEVFYYDASEI
jgi:poly(3-hydroxybutyrate) depolymerase